MKFEVADLVEMKSFMKTSWEGAYIYHGIGIITSVGITCCTVDWIKVPWGGVERLRTIDLELLRKIEVK
jgi:hypothetical protein